MPRSHLPPRSRLRTHLKRGGLIAYPTESSYALGCLAQHPKALRRLIRLKKRPQHKGLISIGANLAQISRLITPLLPEEWQTLVTQWPAPKTYLLPAKANLPILLRGKQRHEIAVRIPQHTLARALCRQALVPLVSTSCNKAGQRPCHQARQAQRLFGKHAWVIGGRCGKQRQPSQIIRFKTGERLR